MPGQVESERVGRGQDGWTLVVHGKYTCPVVVVHAGAVHCSGTAGHGNGSAVSSAVAAVVGRGVDLILRILGEAVLTLYLLPGMAEALKLAVGHLPE